MEVRNITSERSKADIENNDFELVESIDACECGS